MTEERSTAAVALVADLMFASRVRGAAAVVGVEAATVSRPDRLLPEVQRLRPHLVLVDLHARGLDIGELVRQLKADPVARTARIVAFGSHVNAEALQAARDAGADRVLARSALVRDLPALLRG